MKVPLPPTQDDYDRAYREERDDLAEKLLVVIVAKGEPEDAVHNARVAYNNADEYMKLKYEQ